MGNPRENLIGKNVYDFFPRDQADFFTQKDREVLSGKKVVDIPEEPIRTRYKGERILHTKKVPILNTEGEPEYLLGISEDITEHKQTEEALQKSEEKYRSIFENAMEGIFQTTPEGQYISVNPAIARMLGYRSPREMIDGIANIGEQIYVNPMDRKRFRESLDTEGIIEGFETQMYRKDGDKIWVLLNARAIKDANGTILYYEGTGEDITKRKQIQEELRRSESMYQTIFDNTGTSMIIIDENTTIVLCNEEWVKLSGYSREENEGKKSWTEFTYEDDLKGIRAYHERRRTDPENVPRQYEFRFIDRHGNIHNVINTVAMIPGTKMSVAAQLDITDLKKAETEKTYLESQLRQSQKMEAIGTLAGGVAHDFNNILTAIIGYGSLLQMSMGGDPRKCYVDQILASSQRAAILTQSLLAFSRKQVIELKPRMINEIIRESEKLLKRLLTEDIEFTVIPSDPDITIEADVTQIDQVLMNLATNARDAMPKGGRLIIETKAVYLDSDFARTHGFGEAGDYACLSVTDTGIGIGQETQQKIFEPFFTTKEVGKGTGLGLSLVYGIIKQHNGYITVFSEPHKGTRFVIYLPIVKTLGRETKETHEHTKGGNETILLAEDNNEVRGLAKKVLTDRGYTVIEAIDGEDAIRQFVEHNDEINLLLLDVVMPKRNGKEVYDAIRRVRPGVKALFTSGYTGDVVLIKGVRDEAINYISKPLTPKELLKKVREVLDK